MKLAKSLTPSLFFQEELDILKKQLAAIQELAARGAMFVVNHSGGKDSQAMFNFIVRLVPAHQIYVIHATLGLVEWPGVIEHIKATIQDHELHTCRSRRTLIEMIKERGMFPSPEMRQCTSDLKRGPIERTIRHEVERRIGAWCGLSNVRSAAHLHGRTAALEAGMGLVVNCMGLRAEESTNRAKLQTLKLSVKNSKNGREWYDWLPIHHWSADEVFDYITACGQVPHYAYALGMSRLSCAFCIMASKEDLVVSAKHNHKVFRIYVDLEKETGHVMMMPSKSKGRLTLEELTGVTAKTDMELALL